MSGATATVANGGWQPFTQKDVARLLTGNMVEESVGKWVEPYASDERQAVWVYNVDAHTLKRFVNDQAEWRETLFRDEALRCGPQLQANGAPVRSSTQYGAVSERAHHAMAYAQGRIAEALLVQGAGCRRSSIRGHWPVLAIDLADVVVPHAVINMQC